MIKARRRQPNTTIPMNMRNSDISLPLVLSFPGILRLITVRLGSIRPANILPILNFLAGLTASGDGHRPTLVHISPEVKP